MCQCHKSTFLHSKNRVNKAVCHSWFFLILISEVNSLRFLGGLQVMSEDLVPEKMREDSQDGEGLDGISLQSFSQHWWNKVLGSVSECTRGDRFRTATHGQTEKAD